MFSQPSQILPGTIQNLNADIYFVHNPALEDRPRKITKKKKKTKKQNRHGSSDSSKVLLPYPANLASRVVLVLGKPKLAFLPNNIEDLEHVS